MMYFWVPFDICAQWLETTKIFHLAAFIPYSHHIFRNVLTALSLHSAMLVIASSPPATQTPMSQLDLT